MANNIKWKSKTVGIDEINPFDKNPRIITDDKLNQLVESIKQFGHAGRIIVDSNKVIIGGHANHLAMKKLGFKKVDILYPDRDLSEDEFKKLNISLNKIIVGDWDFDKLNDLMDYDQLIDLGFEETDFDIEVEDYEFDRDKELANEITIKSQYGVIVICDDEAQQKEVFDNLTEQGYNIKLAVV